MQLQLNINLIVSARCTGDNPIATYCVYMLTHTCELQPKIADFCDVQGDISAAQETELDAIVDECLPSGTTVQARAIVQKEAAKTFTARRKQIRCTYARLLFVILLVGFDADPVYSPYVHAETFWRTGSKENLVTTTTVHWILQPLTSRKERRIRKVRCVK